MLSSFDDSQEVLNSEINSVSDNVAHMRMRIVQSPERIKRTISTMSKTASEDKKILSLTEAKARDLKAKVEALHTIEQVCQYHVLVQWLRAVGSSRMH